MFLGGQGISILPATGCEIIQVDTDATEIGRFRAIDLGIVSDVEACLVALLNSSNLASIRVSDEWAFTATGLKDIPSPHDKEPFEIMPGRPHPYHALKALFKTLGSISPGAIVCLDGGEAQSWAAGLAHFCKPHLVMFAGGYMGFLGTGFGYALGSAIAEPSRLIVNIQGDGSAGFHIAELDTYARFKCKVLTVVVNNGCWGMSSNGQDEIYGTLEKKRPASMLSEGMKFDVLARGLGIASKRVDKVDDVEDVVKALLDAGGPMCLELIVNSKPTHPGTVAMIGKTNDPNRVVIPYYDNIPRAFYKE